MNRTLISSLCAVLVMVILACQAYGQACQWTSLGPTNINGRITGIAIHTSYPERVFVTSVGGLWRSNDGGRRWQRLSDGFIRVPKLLSSVAINPADPREIFVGGGDPNYRSGGGGIWRSGDSGSPGSWGQIGGLAGDGLPADATVIRLLIDTARTNDIYAATMSGLYKSTTDASGVRSWARLGSFDAPVSDVVADFTSSPPKIYVGTVSASPSFAAGIWKYDGTMRSGCVLGLWCKRDSGITGAIGPVALAISKTEPNILYAKIVQAGTSALLGVYKTINGGDAWANLPAAGVVSDGSQAEYNNVIEVDPTNAAFVWAGDVGCYMSPDGGLRWIGVGDWSTHPPYRQSTHGDVHAIAFDPRSSRHVVYVGTDGGLYKSTNTTESDWHWKQSSHGMVITEFYSVASQQARVTMAVGGTQDSGEDLTYGNRAWYNLAVGDGQVNGVAVDAQNSSTTYLVNLLPGGSEFKITGNPVAYTEGGGSRVTFSTVPRMTTLSGPVVTDNSLAGRALASGTLAAGGGALMQTNGGANWNKIGPTVSAGAIKVIAIAPNSRFGTYYVGLAPTAGTSPARIWRYLAGGLRVETISAGIPTGKEPSGIAVDYTRDNRAFATIGPGGNGEVLMTTDGGANWHSIPGSGADMLPAAGIAGVAIDPTNPDVIYIATTVGVFRGNVTVAGGTFSASWSAFNDGIPDGINVTAIWINAAAKILYIGTMGYGAYELDIARKRCPSRVLVVRDSVLDRGFESTNDLPDPEHPIPDTTRPGLGFYKPDDTASGRLYWWQSTDIRIYEESAAGDSNKLVGADSVEFEACPVEHRLCEAGQLIDSNPRAGHPATAYVQVTNRGTETAHRVRVILLHTDDATTGLPDLPDDFWSRTFPPADTDTPCSPLTPGSGWSAVDADNPCRIIEKIDPAMPEVIGFTWNVSLHASEHTCMIALIESADDPIDPGVRARNERRVWVLAPENRQIAVRNLHVVNPAREGDATRGSAALSVPNPDPLGQHPIDLYFSKAGMPTGGKLAILLPLMSSFTPQGMKRVPARLSDKERMRFSALGLDISTAYLLIDRDGAIEHFRIPRGRTQKIGLLYDTITRGRPNSAARFTIIERQDRKLLGGSVYILRH